MKIPKDFNGVESVRYGMGKLMVKERGGKGREISMNVGELFAAK